MRYFHLFVEMCWEKKNYSAGHMSLSQTLTGSHKEFI